MTHEQKLAYVRQQLEIYRTLDRPACDKAAWVALKLSCSRDEAETLIREAMPGVK